MQWESTDSRVTTISTRPILLLVTRLLFWLLIRKIKPNKQSHLFAPSHQVSQFTLHELTSDIKNPKTVTRQPRCCPASRFRSMAQLGLIDPPREVENVVRKWTGTHHCRTSNSSSSNRAWIAIPQRTMVLPKQRPTHRTHKIDHRLLLLRSQLAARSGSIPQRS